MYDATLIHPTLAGKFGDCGLLLIVPMRFRGGKGVLKKDLAVF